MSYPVHSFTVIEFQDASPEEMRDLLELARQTSAEVRLVNPYDCQDNRRSLHSLLADVERGWLVSAVRSTQQNRQAHPYWLSRLARRWAEQLAATVTKLFVVRTC
ncbi:MAG: hypothetical protein HQL90_01140 [Magnetococcales bacterium]|nr:hypothetical protein [Magnetococcales bacterium]